MKILIITNLFPNRLEPERATYNRQQVYMLSKLCQLKVIAPIAWYPFKSLINKNIKISDIPYREIIDDIEVFHPKYFMIPKIGRAIYGILFFISILLPVVKIYKSFRFNIIFATWAYPDSYAALLIAKLFGKPIITKVHGTDINEYTKYYIRRKMITFALKKTGKVISVSNALKSKIMSLGVSESKIKVINNGIDKVKFKPMNKIQIRQKLKLPLDSKIILFVGNLVQIKGLDYLLDAFFFIKENNCYENILLILVGDGALREHLQDRVKKMNLEKYIIFEGVKPHNEIPYWINACDLFCLPSISEGYPNVIIEALSCGKPVVASNVGGIPEIVTNDNLGILVPPGDPNKLAEAIIAALQKNWDMQTLSKSGDDWMEVAKKTIRELENLVNSRI